MIHRIKSWHVIVVFLLLGTALYSNVIMNGIFIFDDSEYVTDNALIRDFSNVNLSDPRQIGYLSFALNYAAGEYDPRGYHAVNVAIHIANAIIVFFLIRMLLDLFAGAARLREDVRFTTAFLSALIFLVHPIETMAVAYISQRFTSLATLFYLLAVTGYILSRRKFEADRESRSALVLYGSALLSTLLAVRTKEITFTIPVVLAAVEVLAWKGSSFGRRRFVYLLPFAVLVLIIPLSIFGPNLGLLPGGEGIAEITRQEKVYDFVERPPLDYLLTQFRVIVTYMRLLLLPANQSTVYDIMPSQSFFEWRVILSIGLILLVLTAAYKSWRWSSELSPEDAPGAKLITLGLLWFFITLSVESSIIPIKDLMFEHRTYLPSVGFFAACSALVVLGMKRTSKQVSFPVSSIVVVLTIALPLSAATWLRNGVWTDEVRFWDDVVKKTPNKAIGYHNRGNAYGKLGQLDLALQDINKTISFFPKNPAADLSYDRADFSPSNMAKTYMNRASVYFELGLKELGQADNNMAKNIISAPPLDTEKALKLAEVYSKKGAYKHAIEEYSKVLTWDPTNRDALNDRANAFSWTSNYRQAIDDLSRVVLLYPDYAAAYHNRGIAYLWSNQKEQAKADFQQACEMGFTPACESIEALKRKQ